MGDIVLMKTFIIIFLLFVLNLNSGELEWVDEQIEAIKPVRVGLKASDLSSVKDPMVLIIVNEKTGKKSIKKSRTKSKARSYKKYSKRTSKSKNRVKSNPVIKHSFFLEAIMNSSALINNKWYKLGDKINKYTIHKIERTSVVLTANGKYIMLSTSNKNRTIKFKNR